MTTARNYELMFILSGKLSKENIKPEIDKIEKAIGGKIIKKDEWGTKDLAYEIKKEKTGYYIIYYVETGIDNIDEVNHLVRINKSILRLMVIKHDEWPFKLK